MKVELGSHRKLGSRLLQLFLSNCLFGHCPCDSFRTAVETAVSEVHKLLGTGEVPTSLTLLFWRWLDGLFGLYGSERVEELFMS